jgi:hypothetical protein
MLSLGSMKSNMKNFLDKDDEFGEFFEKIGYY